MIREWRWRGDSRRDRTEIGSDRTGCELLRRSRRVLVAEGGHSENPGERKAGDDHPGALFGRTPRPGALPGHPWRADSVGRGDAAGLAIPPRPTRAARPGGSGVATRNHLTSCHPTARCCPMERVPRRMDNLPDERREAVDRPEAVAPIR